MAEVPVPSRRKNKAKPVKTKKKGNKIVKTIIILLLFILLSVLVYAGYIVKQANDKIDDISIVETVDSEGIPIKDIPSKESVKEKSVAMLLLGVDQRAGAGGLNTDVIMVAAFNPVTKKAAVVSMPRDTLIDIDGFRARKANAFYADFYVVAQRNGADKAGAMLKAKEQSKEVFSNYFDMPIQYAASVNFQGFRDLVDVLGGIEVDVDMRMRWTDSHDNTNIDLQPGLQTLDGKNTLDFVRYRQSKDGKNMSSDFERNERQGKVMKAIMGKLLSLSGVTKANELISEVSDDIYTDMPSREIRRMVSTYFGINMNNVTFKSLEGKWSSPYVHADEESLAEAKKVLQEIMAE